MKKLIYYISMVSFCAYAQNETTHQKVYHTRAFQRTMMGQQDLARDYHALNIIQPDDRKNNVVLNEVAVKRLVNDLQLMANSRNVAFHKYNETKGLPVELMVQPDGTIDYFIYGFQPILRPNGARYAINDSLNAENTKKLEAFADYFCRNYKLPKGLSQVKYRVNFMLNIGAVTKKPSKMYIWNKEMAEACDKPDTVKTLMLNNLYLEEFPGVVLKFKNLEELDLSNNYIQKIPKAVSGMSKLRFLSISNNPINKHKIKFKKNTHLKDLNVQFTGIRMIPRSLARNRGLEVLFLGNNRFDKFRKRDFTKLDSLKALNLYNAGLAEVPANVLKLNKLEELDLYYNKLKSLPESICDMPNLKTLAVSNNDLWNLPASLAKLRALETIYAHHNALTELPPLPDLKLLHLSHNLFKTFPEEVNGLQNLIEFDISQNQLQEVPVSLRKLGKLQRVFIDGNDFSRIVSKQEELTKLVSDLEKKDILVR